MAVSRAGDYLIKRKEKKKNENLCSAVSPTFNKTHDSLFQE